MVDRARTPPFSANFSTETLLRNRIRALVGRLPADGRVVPADQVELLRRNIPIRLVDSASGPFLGSRGKGVQPRSLEIFDLIGIADEMVAVSSLYPFMKVHFGPFGFKTGSLGTHHPSSEALPYPNMLMIPQWRTEEILRAHLIKLGGKIEYDTGLAAVDQSDEGVTVTLTSGERVEARYLVGCDGGRSATRKAIGLELGRNTSGAGPAWRRPFPS
ncbi:MAG: putative monooxygenase [Caulobacter sp.]|nr:putative monooxygenase [Caulobacter sp.]